jgi:hypothetical protein
MAQEMTSFVLRFVREVGEEHEARWRGLVQHVQSGAERNFADFADAVKFMQGRVLENTVRALDEANGAAEKNPLVEMAAMWGELAPLMTAAWADAFEQVVGQSAALRSQVDNAVANVFKAWGLSTGDDRDAVLEGLGKFGEQIEILTARVEALESELAAGTSAQSRDG